MKVTKVTKVMKVTKVTNQGARNWFEEPQTPLNHPGSGCDCHHRFLPMLSA
jgi:hypothetical protein